MSRMLENSNKNYLFGYEFCYKCMVYKGCAEEFLHGVLKQIFECFIRVLCVILESTLCV